MTVTRGTSNGNDRGNNAARRRRREWLVETFQADINMVVAVYDNGAIVRHQPGAAPNDFLNEAGLIDFLKRRDAVWDTRAMRLVKTEPARLISVEAAPACRCYRCGTLLTADTVTVDRIVPGCLGGTYAHNNIRPACMDCNAETGAAMANSTAMRVAKMRARILKIACGHCGAGTKERCRSASNKPLSIFHAPRREAA